MVVKTNRGIYEVTSVDIICEKRVPFNGNVVRLVQKANHIADASALKFNLGVSALELPYAEDSIFVGNLGNAVLQETVDYITQTGYADLTKWAFQKEQVYPNKYVFDDGVSAPYICGGTIGMLNPFISEDIYDDFDNENEDDLSKFDDEQLREVLRELGDYSFLQLGQMTREELETEYNRLEVEQ